MDKTILKEISEHYDLRESKVTLLRHNENKTYRMGEDYLLQIHESVEGFHTEYFYMGLDRMEVRKSEFTFLQYLKEQGLIIREPILNLQGEFITTISTGATLTISKWIEGEALDQLELTDTLCYQVGEMIAGLHKCAKGFQIEKAISYDAKHCQYTGERVKDLEVMGLALADSLLMQKVCEGVAEILKGKQEEFRLLHADLSLSNILRTSKGLVAIDFSLFGYGHPMLDLALLFGNISLVRRQKIAEGYKAAGGKIDYKVLDAYFVLTIVDCILIHYEKWRNEDWFAERLVRWCKESFEPFIKGERLFADDFYLIHVK